MLQENTILVSFCWMNWSRYTITLIYEALALPILNKCPSEKALLKMVLALI